MDSIQEIWYSSSLRGYRSLQRIRGGYRVMASSCLHPLLQFLLLVEADLGKKHERGKVITWITAVRMTMKANINNRKKVVWTFNDMTVQAQSTALRLTVNYVLLLRTTGIIIVDKLFTTTSCHLFSFLYGAIQDRVEFVTGIRTQNSSSPNTQH